MSPDSGSNAELILFSDLFTVIYKVVGTHDVLHSLKQHYIILYEIHFTILS